ncbi:MAG: type II secretion system F family protein [Acidimicrobiales bacterium]|jgi:hypothetical protein
MTEVVVLAVLAACGGVGVMIGLRPVRVPLDAVMATWQRPVDPRGSSAPGRGTPGRLGTAIVTRVDGGRWASHPRMQSVLTGLAITDTDPARFASRLVVTVGLCGLGPICCWLVLQAAGLPVPLGTAVLVAIAAAPTGVFVSVASLLQKASDRRRHFRVVVGSFVDLVVLGLAGGVGIDGALFAASQVSSDWAAQRLGRALLTARDSGIAPWSALAAVGAELGVTELVELSTTVQLAGTEGARIRQSLVARGASLRRHEQAEAESAANAMTERLFFPGALLLIGFLVFIGFPAVHRILGGF